MQEEYVPEASEPPQRRGDGDVLDEIFGDGSPPEHHEYSCDRKAKRTSPKRPTGGGASGAPGDRSEPKPPDMLSLSIAIYILVKFCLSDLVGFFQVRVRIRVRVRARDTVKDRANL